jgi:hypothetical protein
MAMDWIRRLGAGTILLCLGTLSGYAADVAQPWPGPVQPPPPTPLPPPPDQNLSPVAIGLTGGTLGFGGEVSYLAHPFVVLRVTGTWLKFDPSSFLSNFSANDNNYNFSLSQLAVGGLLDVHPFRNGFRVVAGVEYADFSFRQSTSTQTTYNINNQPYTFAQIGNLYTSVSIKNEAAPYFGLGWDSAFYCGYIDVSSLSPRCDRFTIGFDLGALYTGGVSVTQSTDKTVVGLAANLSAESSSLEASFNKFYSFYPVAMLTAKFRF